MVAQPAPDYLPLDFDWLAAFDPERQLLLGKRNGPIVVRLRADAPAGAPAAPEDATAYVTEIVRLARIGQMLEAATAAAAPLAGPDAVQTDAVGWTLIEDRDVDSGREGIIVSSGDRTGPQIGFFNEGRWWGKDGFQLVPQPIWFLAGSRIPRLPKAVA